MKNLGSESQVVLEVLVADQVQRSHQHPCRSVPAEKDQAALRATWMPSLWVHVASVLLDLPVELEAEKAAVEQLAPLAPLVEISRSPVVEEQLEVQLEARLVDVVDLDPVAAAVVVEVVEPISMKHCEMPAEDQHHHLERDPW